MTRAPASASLRLASGAATAWSSDSTRMPASGCICLLSLQEAAAGKIAHEGPEAKFPSCSLRAQRHAVGEEPELGRGDGRHVAHLVGETLPLGAAILHGCEHGAEVEHGTVGILMMPAQHLLDEVRRI